MYLLTSVCHERILMKQLQLHLLISHLVYHQEAIL